MKSKSKKLIHGSALRIAEFLTNAIVGLMLMPFIIHSLGDKMYGLWIFVGSFLGYYGLMDLGLNSAIQRYVSRAIGLKDHDETNRVVNTSLVVFGVIGCAILAASTAVAFVVPMCVKNVTEIALFKAIVMILGLNFAIGFPCRVFSGILSANLRYDIRSSVEIIKVLIRTIFVIVFLKMGGGVLALALITLILDIIGYVVLYFIVRRLYDFIKFSRALIEIRKVKSLFSYSIYTFITQIADQLRFNIDNIVIVNFIGLNFVTMYSIGSRLIRYFMDFMVSAFGMTLPIFSQYESTGDYKSIREKFIFLTKISAYLSMLIGGILIIFGKVFIARWVGDAYADSYYILLILVIPSIFDVMQMPGSGLLYGISKHKYYTFSNVIEGVANLVLSVILVKKYGIYGVAFGRAIPMIFIKIFVQPVYTCKAIGMKPSYFYMNLLLPITGVSLCILALFWLAVKQLIVPAYGPIFALSFLASVVFAFSGFFFGFSSEERKYLLNRVLHRS